MPSWHPPWILHRFCRWVLLHATVDCSCLSHWQSLCEVGMVRGGNLRECLGFSVTVKEEGDKMQGESSLSFPTCHPELFLCPWGSRVQLCEVNWARDAHYSPGRFRRHGLKFQLECREASLCCFSTLCVCPHRRERFYSAVSYIWCPLCFSESGSLLFFVIVLLFLKFLSPDSEHNTMCHYKELWEKLT